MKKYHLSPPHWLVGYWEGSPLGAHMRVDSAGVAIRFAETFEYVIGEPSVIRIVCPIHVNAKQVESESLGTTVYQFRTVEGQSFVACRLPDMSIRVTVDDTQMDFPLSGLMHKVRGRMISWFSRKGELGGLASAG